MPGYGKKRGSKDENIFYSDNPTAQEKEAINKAFQAKDMDVEKSIEQITSNGFSLKILWSDYNDSFSATVTPLERDHPASGTFYSAFHASWQKAVFLVAYLLHHRYDFGDWTKDKAKRFDNDW